MQIKNKKKIDFELAYPTTWPVRFGMSRAGVRSAIGVPYQSFTKNASFSDILTDSFTEVGMHVYYNREDIAAGVELFAYSNQCTVTIKGEALLGQRIDQARGRLREQMESDLVPCEGGFESSDSSLRFYAPESDKRSDATIQAIFIDLTGYSA